MSDRDHIEDKLLFEVRKALDHSTAALSPTVSRRLDNIRQAALARVSVREAVNEGDEELLVPVRASLDDSLEALSSDITGQLNQLRRSAVARARQAPEPTQYNGFEVFRTFVASLSRRGRLTIPVSAFATACVVLTAAILFDSIPGLNRVSPDELDVLLVATSDEIELYENLDFYLWLADNELLDQ